MNLKTISKYQSYSIQLIFCFAFFVVIFALESKLDGILRPIKNQQIFENISRPKQPVIYASNRKIEIVSGATTISLQLPYSSTNTDYTISKIFPVVIETENDNQLIDWVKAISAGALACASSLFLMFIGGAIF